MRIKNWKCVIFGHDLQPVEYQYLQGCEFSVCRRCGREFCTLYTIR